LVFRVFKTVFSTDSEVSKFSAYLAIQEI